MTSRRALRIEGEYVHDLGPMSLPTETEEMASEALQLFFDRARMAEPHFAVDSQAAQATVVKLVTRLEGIPLATELAAAQMCRATPAEVLHVLDGRRIDLPHIAHDVDRRHLTLRHAFDSSWALLSRSERQVLAQISVFAGPFSLDDARAVVRVKPEERSLADQLVVLREMSWIRVVRGSNRQCWDLFASIRTYANSKLAADPDEHEATESRHAAYFLERGDAWTKALATWDVVDARSNIIRSAADLRLAQSWCLRSSNPRRIERAVRLALTLHAALKSWQPGLAVDALSQSLAELEGSRDCFSSRAEYRDWLARLLVARAEALRESGRYSEASADLDRVGDLEPVSAPLHVERSREEAMLLYRRGFTLQARRKLKRALVEVRRFGLRSQEARIRSELGYMLLEGMLDPSAEHHFEISLGLYRQLGDVVGEVTARLHQGTCVTLLRSDPAIEDELQEILGEARRLRDRWLEAQTFLALGFAAQDREDLDAAEQHYRASRYVARRAGLPYVEVNAYCGEGSVCDERGEWSRASALYRSAARLGRRIGAERLEAYAHTWWSGIVARTRDARSAERMLDRAEAVYLRNRPSAKLEEARIQRAQIHLAHARQARADGDLQGARSHEQASRALVSGAHSPRKVPGRTATLPALGSTFRTRRLLKLIAQTSNKSRPTPNGMRVARDGSAFELGSGERVSVPYGLLRRLLFVLASERDVHPGTPIATDTVIDLAWPDEKMHVAPGRTRVRNAVARLRRAGLFALVTRPGGYMLDPDVAFEWLEPDASS